MTEVDAAALTVAELQSLESQMQARGWGEKSGRTYLVTEAHAPRKPVIRQLLVLLERVPRHVVIVFTTTCEGQGLLQQHEQLPEGHVSAEAVSSPGTNHRECAIGVRVLRHYYAI
ncbi:MAG TPA: hypothetical protein VM597_23925 [Gemmataceae bacterium]|nr:hypothetical protein [Gemmataceae bacterium]